MHYSCNGTREWGVGRAQLMTTALRALFRFFFQTGEMAVDLSAAVPTVPDWRLATLPRSLAADDVERLLTACDRQTPTGRRDYAILLLLARLGLRAGEVVALELDDLHWRTGEITIRGKKGRRHERFPLPPTWATRWPRTSVIGHRARCGACFSACGRHAGASGDRERSRQSCAAPSPAPICIRRTRRPFTPA